MPIPVSSDLRQLAYEASRRKWREDHPIITVPDLIKMGLQPTFLPPDQIKGKPLIIEVKNGS